MYIMYCAYETLSCTKTTEYCNLLSKLRLLVLPICMSPLRLIPELFPETETSPPQSQGRLSLSTDGDKCAMVNFLVGGSIKSLMLSFNIQKCEFCAQI